jgi:hypothetical protein
MKKAITFLVMLILVGGNLFANNFQQQIELTYERRTPIGKPDGRSLQMGMEAFLDVPYLVLRSYMTEEQEADIYILNASGEKVMSEFLLLSPFEDTPFYIGDLPGGEYQLVIELQDAVLNGTFSYNN